MHRSGSSSNNGGLFKGNSIFGGSKTSHSTSRSKSTARPRTSNGSTSRIESTVDTAASRTSSNSARKPSFSSSSTKSPSRAQNNLTAITNYSFSPEKRKNSTAQSENRPLPVNAPAGPDPKLNKSADSFAQVFASAEAAVHTPVSGADSFTSTTPYSNMLARPATAYSSVGPPAFPTQLLPPSPTVESITYQHIQETSSKRISTLDYLRKAHEGRVYWFNTLLFNKPDLQRMPYFDTRKLARRATNYLLLGLSIPTIIDLNSSNAVEFLKTLNALLQEFETFQQIHPPDGSSSMSRGRFPQMFKRATATGGKVRRTSSAADIGLPMGSDYSDSNGNVSAGGSNGTSFSISENDLLPGEEYTHLLTPSLPFDPDFYETFATLCDVLIDCYTRLMSLVASPRECSPVVAELFTKADARVRKIIVQGVVKEFEDSSRGGVKNEVAGVGRVVLGGLM